jgi:hypothetical protein
MDGWSHNIGAGAVNEIYVEKLMVILEMYRKAGEGHYVTNRKVVGSSSG